MWYRLATAPKLMSNPVLGGFWVNEKKKNELGEIDIEPRFITYGEPMFVKNWNKLLSTKQIKSEDKDSLKKFLTDNKFKYIGKDKFYVPAPLYRAVLSSS